jgi:hypothetical protein
MRFSGKSSGYFIEVGEYSTLVAKTSSLAVPLVIEKVEEVPSREFAAVGPVLDKLAGGGRRPGAYRHSVCGIYPERRFIRRASLDLKRTKETGYLDELLTTQFRAEPDKMIFALMAAGDGRDVDPSNPDNKEVLFCGGYSDDFSSAQSALLTQGVFPERLELGSVGMLGTMIEMLSLQGSKAPTLVLEVGRETTNCYIVSGNGVELARPIPHGVNSMIPVAQKELGLRDEEAAAKLLFSNTFDFTGMGSALIKRLLKELQSSIGFFEVQTGQSIGQLVCSVIPPNCAWLSSTLSASLGVGLMKLDLKPWMDRQNIRLASGVMPDGVPESWIGLLGLMGRYKSSSDGNENK